MTIPISPLNAAKMARGVYGIRFSTQIAQGMVDGGGNGLSDMWDLSQDGALRATGISGGAGITKKSGFALVLNGKGNRRGEMAVLIRGTKIFPYDFITDAKFAVDPGPTGLGNHAGFNRVYNTIIDQILAGIDTFRGPIHIVGHSLGGAIAHIVAAKLHMGGHRNLKLYSFGSPRSGLPGFAKYLTTSLDPANIYRAYSLADPIAMVPIFPFRHVPHDDQGIRVGGELARITMNDHYMTTYQPLVENADWDALRAASRDTGNLRSIDYWLKQADLGTRIPGSGWGLWALGKVLSLILKLAGKVLGLALLGLATVIDTIAHMIAEAARISTAIGRHIVRFIKLAHKWAGRAYENDNVRLTSQFLTFVLSLLIMPVTTMAARALDTVFD
jgi:pimeloyl-ACP methyl ester carboxylesterase